MTEFNKYKRVDDIEDRVFIFGEQYRKLIMDSLDWIEERQKVWNIVIDRDKFLYDLISSISKE